MGGTAGRGRVGRLRVARRMRRPADAVGRAHRSVVALRRLGLRLGVVAVLAPVLLVASVPVFVPAARASELRVAIIVGPVGRLTDLYRADAERAAAAARRFTDDVVTVYSPNATWKAAKDALRGASLVVYLGHGNGWPSPYSTALNPRTQDGLGLNPVAGVDDVAHQYFGESYLADGVRLAPNAVVILSHLCYASGNSEPGLPEGTLEVAQQRVDNFAAGWLAAGAGAVVADAFLQPAHYVRELLAGSGTIEQIWRGAPSSHDHVLAFASTRSPAFTGLMDPTDGQGGFYRSLVTRADVRAGEVARGAADRAADPAADLPDPPIPPTVESVRLKGRPVAGAALEVVVTFVDPIIEPLDTLGVGVRWDPVAIDAPTDTWARPPPHAPGGQSTSPDPAINGEAPGASPRPEVIATTPPPAASPSASVESASAFAAASASPAASPRPAVADPAVPPAAEGPSVPSLVTPEALGSVVVLADAKVGARSLTAAVVAPEAPGLYRLVTSLHDAEGMALAPPATEPVPALLVRVTRPLSALIGGPAHLDVTTGSSIDLPIVVSNSGAVPWVASPSAVPTHEPDVPDTAPSDPQALLVGHWVRLDLATSMPELTPAWTKLDLAPGATQLVSLGLTAPDLPGEYLLVLDVMSPLDGSLTAAGGEALVVRVTASWPVTQLDQPTAPGVSDPTSAEQGDGQ